MKKLYIFALVAMLFAACATDGVNEPSATIEDPAPETLTVSFEGEESRIQLQEGKTVWNEGDLVSVFYRSNANQKWQFQGATGDRTGNLKQVEMGTATETMNRVVVVYPYAENYYINPETYNIEASLPAQQTYIADSYGVGGNIMVSSGEYNQVVLRSVCGWLKLELTGNGEKISTITLKGNNGEQVAGQLYINSADATATLASEIGGADDNGSAGGNLVFEDTILKEVTLNCGEGVELSAEPTAFYIALPPQTFEKGLTAVFTSENGVAFEKSTDKAVIIERNTIQPMAALGVETAPAGPANNEIWYTNGSTTEATTPYRTDFGANIISNTYDAEKECWVIKFDGDVTSIGASAFLKCSSLTSVTIPNSATSIGYQAFNACSSLKSATIGNGVISIREQAFSSCSSLTAFYGKFASEDNRCLIVDGALNSFAPVGLTEYTIPDGVTSIGKYAFNYCSSLTSVTIPDSVTLIGIRAFNACSSLTSLIIPDGVTSIEEYAFNACSSLTSVAIGDSVTSIGKYAFSYCSNLRSVTIGNSVTSIGKHAFDACTSSTSIHISDLSAWCKIDFEDNTANPLFYAKNLYLNGNLVTELTIPDSVTKIGGSAFYNCSSIKSVTIPDSVTTIEDNAFTNCISLASVSIGNSVTSIGGSAFGRCSSLTSITIPDSVTSIGTSAFTWCTSLASVTIPDSVTSIGDNAFCNCSSLTSATIGNSVNSIGWEAFSYCGSLTSVYCKPTTPPTGNDYMFYNHSSRLKIYVPHNSVSAYKSIYASGWSKYAYYIEGYDFYEAVDMGLSVKWAATNVGADSPEELGNLYAWGEVSPKTEYYSSNYAWWTYDYSEDGDGWWSTTSIKKYGSSYSNSDYIQWDGYYASYYWVNDGLTVLDLEDDAARTEWGGSWRMPTQAECQELVDNCTIEKVKYNNCDGFLFTSTKAGYTDKKLFFPLTPSKELGDETTYDRYYSGLFWSSTQYLPFPVCAYVFRSSYPYTSCTLGPITRKAGFPVRPVKQ